MPEVMTVMPNVITLTPTYFCKYCNNQFTKRQNKWAHEKKYCKMKTEIIKKSIEPPIIKNTSSTNIINNTNNGTINNINNGTINNITINNYSNDNRDVIAYISDAFIKRMFNYHMIKTILYQYQK